VVVGSFVFCYLLKKMGFPPVFRGPLWLSPTATTPLLTPPKPTLKTMPPGAHIGSIASAKLRRLIQKKKIGQRVLGEE
jgi:hypothetical protein